MFGLTVKHVEVSIVKYVEISMDDTARLLHWDKAKRLGLLVAPALQAPCCHRAHRLFPSPEPVGKRANGEEEDDTAPYSRRV